MTLGRAAFASAVPVLGLTIAVGRTPVGDGLRLAIAAGAAAALGLDGLDGFLARRLRQASAFGARFDMETDALTMLALALLIWISGQTGAWVLLAGLLRYIFIVGGWLWRALAEPLPPRKRRQAACVTQMAAMITALAWPPGSGWGAGICGAGLAFLGYSFGVDIVWLVRRARRGE